MSPRALRRVRFFDLTGHSERIDFPDLLLPAAGAGHEVDTLQCPGYWRDIGIRTAYEAAISEPAEDASAFIGARQS